jgi:uncharacterized membrane protein YdbT with pleckstrin-like domain
VKDLLIRPTMRFIRMGYTAVFVAIALALAFASNIPGFPVWIAAALTTLLLWPAWRQLRRRFTRLVVSGGKLRYEEGIASRITRSFPLGRIQNVRVDQTLRQRVFKVGDLSIETAGETGPLRIRNIDDPHEVADAISEAAQQYSGKGPGL